MDFDLWWLLPIPAIFFALGWIAARIDIKHLLRESRALPMSYFRGLNFLLNEQPDKAIESFIEVVKVDPQTVDLHFALGSLFRRQGEIDRAIRMHQNLLDRPDLPADKRQTALFELAQDFHRAGLLDRAEELFTRLDGSPFEHPSLAFLLSIYEQEKDWPKAIAVTRRMEALAKQPYHKEIAHYDCELAQAALLKSDFATARTYIEQARAEYKASPRATMLAGDMAAQQGDHARAIEEWQKIETQNPAFLALVAERLADAWRKTGGAAQGLRTLGAYQQQYPSLDLLNTVFSLTLVEEGAEAAASLIKEELARNPTLLGLDRLLEAQLASAPAERRHDLELVKQLVGQHIKRLGMYKCEHCGFRAKQYYWRCPGCGKWETYSPRRTETPDGYA
ncbi:MAG: lipopolysaccharide assembly protein LapB [Betaproteobacteria bacterium]|nr:lipopolysaccharide assembly protein LapB [Betaproteobacteria bacterium]MBK9704614.1 lipopolysaccharide assembly protein LapB [Betaproteobacteria bacterium]MBL0289277.1 lipopolysaccharide assembly protein LapB [Betaproteobacteria bacterium]